MDQLRDHFEVKVFGEISNYLGIEFRKTESGYILSQEKFLKKLLKDFKLDDSYGKNIPWIPNDKYEKVAIIRENVNPENDFEKVPNETLLDPDAKNYTKVVLACFYGQPQHTSRYIGRSEFVGF